jgi:hypothetical protein
MHTSTRFILVTVWITTLAVGQAPVLMPTSNMTIATGTPLHYSSILIPAGVTLTFVGSAPAIVVGSPQATRTAPEGA